MQICICVSILATFVFGNESSVNLTNYRYTNDGNGAYSLEFRTSNGIERNETSRIVEKDGKQYRVVNGTYKHIAPNGNLYKVTYKANDRGFYFSSRLLVPVDDRIGTNTIASLSG